MAEIDPTWPPPVPTKKLKSYTWLFLALGTGNGLIWSVCFEALMGPRTAHIVTLTIAAIAFTLVQIQMFLEDRRIKRWQKEYEQWVKIHREVFKVPNDRD